MNSRQWLGRLTELAAEDQWALTYTKKHFVLRHPKAKNQVIVSKSPSDFRAYENVKAMMRRELRKGTLGG